MKGYDNLYSLGSVHGCGEPLRIYFLMQLGYCNFILNASARSFGWTSRAHNLYPNNNDANSKM